MKRWLGMAMMVLLAGCQSDDGERSVDVTRAEVVKIAEETPSPEQYEAAEGDVIRELTDDELAALQEALKSASVTDLANEDLALPLYQVRFYAGEERVMTLGYRPPDEEDGESTLLDIEASKRYTTDDAEDLVK